MMKKFFACLLMLALCLFALGAQAETLTMTQTVQPTVDLPGSNEELFAYYVEQELYTPIYGERSMFGTSAREKLTAQQQLMYDALKAEIVNVANNGGTTQFVFDPTTINGLEYTFTKAQLGVTEFTHIVEGGAAFTEETSNAVNNIIFGDVLNALLHDCPLEMYWFNKTAGMSQGFGGSISGDTLTITQFVVTMQVASAYQDENAATPTVVKSASLETVLSSAQSVVTNNADKTDLEKLRAFKDYICSLVEYNDAAADNSSTPYGDPWQLIYVFDGNSDTKVVCEGYSKAFQYLCDLAGLECYTVSGTMTGGTGAGRHMWNIVRLNEKNYLVDVTNCDTGTIGEPDLLFLEEPIRGNVDEGYVFAGGNSQEVTYQYDNDLIWDDEVLTLAKTTTPITYTITCSEAENYGFFEVDKTSAEKDETVVVHVQPVDGYGLASLVVTYGDNESITPTGTPGYFGRYTFTMPAANVTVTATFAPIYKITFDLQGGICTVPDGNVLETDTDGKLTQEQIDGLKYFIKRKGYEYNCATLDRDGKSTQIGVNTVFTVNTTVYVQWEPVESTIYFVMDGGDAIAPITQDYGTAVTAPADPTKKGYTFAGWDKTIPTTMPAEDMTITAQWEPINYKVIFHANGGTGTMADQTFKYGENKALTENVFSREGYRFGGWNTTDNGSGVKYKDGELVGNLVTVQDGVIELYAIWERVYKITVEESSYGQGTVSPNTFINFADITMEVTPNTGYVLNSVECWKNDGYNGILQVVDASSIPIKLEFHANTDCTLRMVFEPIKYTIRFVNEDGTELQVKEVAYGETPVYTGRTPVKENVGTNKFTFKSWTPEIVAVTGDATYTATYTTSTLYHTVTWLNEAGETLATESVIHGGETTTTIAVPEKTGYTGKWDHDGKSIVQDTIIKPIYTPNSYKLTWSNGDGGSYEQDIDCGKPITVPSNEIFDDTMRKAGYTLTGWINTDGYKVGDAMPAQALTFTAQYEVNQYTITLDVTGQAGNTVELDKDSAAAGETVNVKVVPVAGDELVSISLTDGNGKPIDLVRISESEYGFTMPASAVTLSAVFEETVVVPTTYTVTFVDWKGAVITTVTVKAGEAATAPVAPTREGYTFTGWDKEFTNVTTDLTVTATYAEIQPPTEMFTVSIINGVGAGSYAPGDSVQIRADVIEGKVFVGWQGAENLIFTSGNANTANATVIMPEHDVNLTATYEAISEPGKDVVITSPAEDRTIVVYEGEKAEMAITAENAVAYQWYVNYSDSTGWHRLGENSPAYTTVPTSLVNDGNRYKCVATGENGSTAESVIFHLCVLEHVNVPETGDRTDLGLLSAMLLLSGAGCLLLAKNRKRIAN